MTLCRKLLGAGKFRLCEFLFGQALVQQGLGLQFLLLCLGDGGLGLAQLGVDLGGVHNRHQISRLDPLALGNANLGDTPRKLGRHIDTLCLNPPVRADDADRELCGLAVQPEYVCTAQKHAEDDSNCAIAFPLHWSSPHLGVLSQTFVVVEGRPLSGHTYPARATNC